MKYIDSKTIENIEADAFRDQQPFPWVNPHGFLTDSGYRELVETMPDLESMTPSFGSTPSVVARPGTGMRSW